MGNPKKSKSSKKGIPRDQIYSANGQANNASKSGGSQ
jgi:hypothetical protein